MNELEVKFPASMLKNRTERDSLSILKGFIEKQEALLDAQESQFVAVSDEIIRELKAADYRIEKSQHEIDSLKLQTRLMLSEIQASIR
jgi:hypothetical protein